METQAQKNEDTVKYNAAIKTLEQVFNLQIPDSVERLVVRRLLTISARMQSAKVTPEVAELLKLMDARVPEYLPGGKELTCYGILYQKNHIACSNCGLARQCKISAENVGLGEITLSPKLLGNKSTRWVTIIPNSAKAEINRHVQEEGPSPSTGIPPLSERDNEIYNHLMEVFSYSKSGESVMFGPKEMPKKFILCLDLKLNVLQLRFIKAGVTLKPALEKRKGGNYYLPASADSAEALRLIDLHTQQILNAAH